MNNTGWIIVVWIAGIVGFLLGCAFERRVASRNRLDYFDKNGEG